MSLHLCPGWISRSTVCGPHDHLDSGCVEQMSHTEPLRINACPVSSQCLTHTHTRTHTHTDTHTHTHTRTHTHTVFHITWFCSEMCVSIKLTQDKFAAEAEAVQTDWFQPWVKNLLTPLVFQERYVTVLILPITKEDRRELHRLRVSAPADLKHGNH